MGLIAKQIITFKTICALTNTNIVPFTLLFGFVMPDPQLKSFFLTSNPKTQCAIKHNEVRQGLLHVILLGLPFCPCSETTVQAQA